MKNESDVPVKRLVVDSGAFIKRAPLQDLGAEVYTTSGVIEELKCSKMRDFLNSIPYEVIIREPSKESIDTSDYPALSAVDIMLLALAHDLHVKAYGSESLNYRWDGAEQNTTAAAADEKAESTSGSNERTVERIGEEAEKGPMKDEEDELEMTRDCQLGESDVNGESNRNKGSESESEDSDDKAEDDDSDGGDWITEENVQEKLLHLGEVSVPAKDMEVACITTDFAVQNVLLRMGMNLLSVDGFRIQRLRSYVLRCRACFLTTSQMTKRFCPRCGNDTLHRVAVTVDSSGNTNLHINWKRLQSKRGLKFSLPAPKGGKHSADPQLFEDQPMPQNRLAKCRQDPIKAGPFPMIDVTSRSAALGIRTLQKRLANQNPNARSHGRKRGNKRR